MTTNDLTYSSKDSSIEEGYTPWRWLVLLAFMMNTALNSFMFMDFTEIPSITKEVFGYCPIGSAADDCGGGDEFVAWSYNVPLLATLPVFFIVLAYIDKHNWATTFFGWTSNLASAWLRYTACVLAQNGRYSEARHLAVLSSVFLGFAAAMLIVSYSSISHRWFPEKERGLATCLAVQSNYMGWTVGTVLFPYLVDSGDSLVTVQLYQALAVTIAFCAFLVAHRERPSHWIKQTTGGIHNSASGAAYDEDNDVNVPIYYSVPKKLLGLFTNPQYMIQCACFSVLGAVSFFIPGYMVTIVSGISDFSEKEAAWVNFTFVFSGVVVGLVAPVLFKAKSSWPLFLKSAFVVNSLAFVGLVALTYTQNQVAPDTLRALVYVLSSMCGGSSLGFIGIALAAISVTGSPVKNEYASGFVEWNIQWITPVLGQIATATPLLSSKAFVIAAIPVWVVTILMLTLYNQKVEVAAAEGGPRAKSVSSVGYAPSIDENV